MANVKKIVDGCTAASYVAYAFSEVATIYPITPIASMGETADRWNSQGLKNLFGSPMQVKEMESELGAAGATHGALVAGALATTFTASQGLMLMLPNMYKISGELLPGVFHVGCRSLATQALSIFGDHQDVMACRATGFSLIASASVQETHDLAIVSHLSAIEGRVPVLHFFDGWRTSNEMDTISMVPYDDLKPLVPYEKVLEFRKRSINPEHPDLRGSAQNSDVYFQNREAANKYYNSFPDIVQANMDKVAPLVGKNYHLFDYSGDPDADRVIISMGSSCDVVEETVNYLNGRGEKTGLIKVRLYRPFSAKHLLDAIPESVKAIAVLDRTKEPGAEGEPLYLDVSAALYKAKRQINLIGGRYGLSSKEFDPSMAKRVFDELKSENPKDGFTIGINDDVTYTSLDVTDCITTISPDIKQAVFYGMGSDGTVGATKMAAQIIGNAEDVYAQAYFHYSAKKSGGYTLSELRIGPKPITSAYGIENADFVMCNKDTYTSRFDIVKNLKEGGILVLNSRWTPEQMNTMLPPSLRKDIAVKKIKLYNLDATKIAAQYNLGVRINTIMLTAFLKLAPVVPFQESYSKLKDLITETYEHEGMTVVDQNLNAIETALNNLIEINYPASWADAQESIASGTAGKAYQSSQKTSLPGEYLKDVTLFNEAVAVLCNKLEGDDLPVSVFSPDGTIPMGTTAFEKRRIAIKIPEWDADKCVECTLCSYVCPHATIRPYLLNTDEKNNAPAAMTTKDARYKELKGLQWRIQVYPEDCVGCGSCAVICPGHALTMNPLESQLDTQIPLLEYAQKHITIKDNLLPRNTIAGSQMHQPLLQFSGACAGCGETPYVKLLTQLMGERLIIANATGCSSIWGANYPSNAYCTDRFGRGPAWGNSLFEDNAEYGFGMAVAIAHRRESLIEAASNFIKDPKCPTDLKTAIQNWLEVKDDKVKSENFGRTAIETLQKYPDVAGVKEMLENYDLFAKKSIWIIGGDGWAYDIGFAGLDHVLAQNVDINVLVMDTECYSNTGGQTSKATPLGCTAKYSYDGKRTYKKDLGRMMMTYGFVYVASIALGANYLQGLQAFEEADSYPGPSIVIAYCPCINHGIRAGMSHSIVEEKLAVKCGYWPLYRFNPENVAKGEPPLTVDYNKPDDSMPQFLDGEDRYADLKLRDPAEATILRPELQERCDNLYDLMKYDINSPNL
ncbi:MAG: pyruvate:ferredoxin (flavodoxin) oxidoreductase [Muribaculaceae bacterium]|nr:pyruvate:ferredoxin (flavodoxin) oxidoreductase [Muribaculaceae bacterium]